AGLKHWFVPRLKFTHDCDTLMNQRSVYRPLWKVYYTFRNRLEMYRIASGWAFPLVLLITVSKCFLTARYYAPGERARMLTVTVKAVWDGICRDYSKSFDQVIALSQ
ncbi:MAG: hypothetical protein ACREO9_07705, partial [Lysobacterales bacterium]